MADCIAKYDLNGEGCYILEVQTPKGWACLDATRRMGSVGRLMNHSAKPNLKPFQPLHIRSKWRVGFLAVRGIKVGEELTWDYGSPPGGHQWLCRRPAPEYSPGEGVLIVLSCIQLLFLATNSAASDPSSLITSQHVLAWNLLPSVLQSQRKWTSVKMEKQDP